MQTAFFLLFNICFPSGTIVDCIAEILENATDAKESNPILNLLCFFLWAAFGKRENETTINFRSRPQGFSLARRPTSSSGVAGVSAAA